MKKYFILSIAVLALSSCKTTMKESWNHFPNQVNLSEYNHLEFVKIKKGNTILVNVEENPSTGYSWKTSSQQDCGVTINEGSYKQNESSEGLVGVPGVRTYEIKANKVGTCLIEFQNYAPASEKPESRKAIYFTVEE